MTGIINDLTPAEYAAARQRQRDLVERLATLDTLSLSRLAAGLSAREVSRRMGVSDATVRRLEAEGSDPTVSLVQRYARAVGMQLTINLETTDD